MIDGPDVEVQLRDALRSEAGTVTGVVPFGRVPADEVAATGRPDRVGTESAFPVRLWLTAAAVAAVVGGIAVTAILQADDPNAVPGGNAACADEIAFRGATYLPVADVTRVPVPGRSLAPGTRVACDDGNGPVEGATVATWAVPGVEPTTAIILDGGTVYARAALPAAVREKTLGEFTERVKCMSAEPISATGVATETTAAPPSDGAAVDVPYQLTVDATGGDVVDLKRYARVVLSVQVTNETDRGRDWSLVSSLLQEAEPVSMTLRCTGTRFVVLSLTRASSARP